MPAPNLQQLTTAIADISTLIHNVVKPDKLLRGVQWDGNRTILLLEHNAANMYITYAFVRKIEPIMENIIQLSCVIAAHLKEVKRFHNLKSADLDIIDLRTLLDRADTGDKSGEEATRSTQMQLTEQQFGIKLANEEEMLTVLSNDIQQISRRFDGFHHLYRIREHIENQCEANKKHKKQPLNLVAYWCRISHEINESIRDKIQSRNYYQTSLLIHDHLCKVWEFSKALSQIHQDMLSEFYSATNETGTTLEHKPYKVVAAIIEWCRSELARSHGGLTPPAPQECVFNSLSHYTYSDIQRFLCEMKDILRHKYGAGYFHSVRKEIKSLEVIPYRHGNPISIQ